MFDANIITNYNIHRLNRKNNKNINPLHDFGVDIIQRTKDDKFVFVQCKNYKNALTVDCLGSFFLVMLTHPDKTGIIYYPNRISRNIIEHLPHKIIKHICEPMKICEQNAEITLHDYQTNAVEKYDEYYKTNKKAIMTMPCGVGKTLVSCHIF